MFWPFNKTETDRILRIGSGQGKGKSKPPEVVLMRESTTKKSCQHRRLIDCSMHEKPQVVCGTCGVETTQLNPFVETTYKPEKVAVKCGNIEINAPRHGMGWDVLIDGVPIRKMRKVIVTLDLDCANTVEVTHLPDYSEKR